MTTRVLLALAMILWLPQDAAPVRVQAQAPTPLAAGDETTSARDLMARLERVATTGNPDDYLTLLTASADRGRALAFAGEAFKPGGEPRRPAGTRAACVHPRRFID